MTNFTNFWLQIHVITDQKYAEIISDLFNENGALAVTLHNTKKEAIFAAEKLWQQVQVTGLYDSNIDAQKILSYVEKKLGKNNIIETKIEKLTEQNWQALATADLQPLFFGEKICICPSWITPPNPNLVNIILDPGLAFGSGTHPTTALCLEWLDKKISEKHTVIDYGCGSGILAITAAKLGAETAYAIDNDPQAITATKENAKRNKISKKIQAMLPEELLTIQADLLIANILANPLIELAPLFAKLVKSDGKLALSGILDEQIELVKSVYQEWFEINSIINEGEWILLSGKRFSA